MIAMNSDAEQIKTAVAEATRQLEKNLSRKISERHHEWHASLRALNELSADVRALTNDVTRLVKTIEGQPSMLERIATAESHNRELQRRMHDMEQKASRITYLTLSALGSAVVAVLLFVLGRVV